MLTQNYLQNKQKKQKKKNNKIVNTQRTHKKNT